LNVHALPFRSPLAFLVRASLADSARVLAHLLSGFLAGPSNPFHLQMQPLQVRTDSAVENAKASEQAQKLYQLRA
jgi:hypothetical protein